MGGERERERKRDGGQGGGGYRLFSPGLELNCGHRHQGLGWEVDTDTQGRGGALGARAEGGVAERLRVACNWGWLREAAIMAFPTAPSELSGQTGTFCGCNHTRKNKLRETNCLFAYEFCQQRQSWLAVPKVCFSS